MDKNMFRTIGNKLKGRTKTVDKTLTDKELVDLLDTYAIIDGGHDIQRANVKYVDDARHYNYALDGLENMPLFDVKEMFLQKLSVDALALDSEYTDINYQKYAGKESEKHYIAIARGEIRHEFGKTVIKGWPRRTASIEFEVKKYRNTPGTLAPVG